MWNPFKSKTKTLTQSYQAQCSRIFKAKIAPKGQIFLIVRYKSSKGIYHSCRLVDTVGLTEGVKVMHYDDMFNKIKTKYGI